MTAESDDFGRREFVFRVGVGGIMLGATAAFPADRGSADMPSEKITAAASDQDASLPIPGFDLAFEMSATLGAPQELGTIEGTSRRIIPITGGVVMGSRLSGIVLPGGADWQTIQSDGLTRIYARYTIRTDTGQLVSVINPGLRHGPNAVMKRLASGETVDPKLYYFRTTPTFEVGSSELTWLTRSIFICVGARFANAVKIRFYELT